MLLMTPGPTPSPEFLRRAMADETIHHRTPEFEAIFGRARNRLKTFMKSSEVILLASTGSGAMEAALTHFCAKRALTINAGKFGERWSKIAAAYGKNPIELKYAWDTPASVADVENALKNNPEIDALFIQICESAGGLRHPAEAIAAAVKAIRPDVFVVADGITAVGVENIDATHIDALIAGSQKAFMLPPGLAAIGLSESAVKRIEATGGTGFYFNLATELKNQRKNTTAWTATTTIVQGLDAFFERLDQIGEERFYADTLKRRAAGEAALKAIGAQIYPKVAAPSMLSVFHQNAASLRKWMKKEALVNVAGGQDDLKDTLLRFNNMGFVEPNALAWSLNALEMAMDKIGSRKYDGAANRAFTETYYR
ncbi:MAG: aminotransferase class V-fold PLP-dependent enzyme [Helicobacteraceae bacterium]|jgi:aspartate aminotransferase-like enzyme|nr:aminotransferase class V-fold PLP-dependent enzyme [Helicobacteraceae bacterium]